MYYNHATGQNVSVEKLGYYAVFILVHGKYQKHVVKAKSDFDAALKVKKNTGIMAGNEDDVIGPLPSFSHGYDKATRDLWLNSK